MGELLQQPAAAPIAGRADPRQSLSVRSPDYAFDPTNQARNLNFSGRPTAWSNAFATVFGFTGVATGMSSNGQFVLHNGPSAVDYVVDLLAFLGPDFIG